MRDIILIIFLTSVLSLLFITNIFSNDSSGVGDILNGLKKVEKVIQHIGDPPVMKCVDDTLLFEQCAMDLCGAPKNSQSRYLTDYNFDQYVPKGVMERFGEIETEITEVILAEKEKTNKLIAGFKQLVADNKYNLDLSKWPKWRLDYFAGLLFDKHIKIEVDRSLVPSKRLELTVNYPENSSKNFRNAIDAYAKRRKEKLENDFLAGVREGFYSMDEAKKKLRTKWDEFWSIFSEARSKNPKFMSSDEKSLAIIEEIKKKITENENNSIQNIVSVVSELENARIIVHTWATGGELPNTKNDSVCRDMECQKGMKEFYGISNVQKLYEELQAENNRDTLVSDVLAHCKSHMAMRGLKDYNASQFRKIMPTIVENFQNNVLKKFSDKTKEKFNDYLKNDLHLTFKPIKGVGSVDEFINRIHSRYSNYKNDTSESGENAYEKDSTYYLEQLELLMTYDNKVDSLKNAKICGTNGKKGSLAWDAFATKEMIREMSLDEVPEDVDPAKDNLFVSMFSCSHQSYGKGISSHELGHVLSWLFANKWLSVPSSGKYMIIRKCATDLYKGKAMKEGTDDAVFNYHHEGDKYRTEEDTADLISFMANPDKSVLHSCATLKGSPNGETYIDLALENKKTETHSSGLLRVLQEALHDKVALPESCTKVIKKHMDKYRFNSCF